MEANFEAWNIARAIEEADAMVESTTPDTKAYYFYHFIANTLRALEVDIEYRDDLLRRMLVLEALCLSSTSSVLLPTILMDVYGLKEASSTLPTPSHN